MAASRLFQHLLFMVIVSSYSSSEILIFSSVGTATGYGLDDRMIGVPFPARAGNFSLLHHVHTGSGVHLVSYPMGTEGSFPGGKAAGV
jgi:hypothetical protein